ncbi:CRISPR-associated protein Cas2 [Pseudobutyrivibrio sp. ACV-2]|uniref:CRISPR-associated endonuclease Cas2 n=1 Tax=Pseudobutyrivibrio sp. ACV-2 TaxID=1520801 RepID=UPI0008944009|nr:CRISPR-associated endonuclease Cas2 [Pseudobutyrivibrio sp. ACV-2]SEA89168.1 CRISPR-associated protein Cas2 [Pseudobutyrivibrio sp. ACV-2]
MKIIVILFPTNKWGTKTEYTNLRKFLLRDGYLRIAPEVFMRITPTKRASEKHYRRLEEVAPKTGIVRVLRITEKQYESIYLLSGEIDYQEKTVGKNCHILL